MSEFLRRLLGGLPLGYAMRNIMVRRAAAFFTALGVALTVAVFAGVIALRQGFEQVYQPRGDLALGVYMRKSASSEGESGIVREQADMIVKERPEVARNAAGQPMAAKETYLAVYMDKVGGGVTNVPLRGVSPMSIEIHGDAIRLVEGRWFAFGSDEIVVGRSLTERIANCRVGDTLQINLTPFRVVGVIDHAGVYGGEVWGDVERMLDALERPFYSRVLARLHDDVDVAAVKKECEDSPRYSCNFMTERAYMASQTVALGTGLSVLAAFLTVIMGLAAVLGAIITMSASVAARTHEIGVLLAIGYPRKAIFLAFLFEAALIGVIGGLLGVLLVLPFHGLKTGAMNWNTFTDISFDFRVTPGLMLLSVFVSVTLGLLGGTLPAIRAALLKPVEAFRAL